MVKELDFEAKKFFKNQKKSNYTLQMFTGVYRVSVGFPCNIYGKGL